MLTDGLQKCTRTICHSTFLSITSTNLGHTDTRSYHLASTRLMKKLAKMAVSLAKKLTILLERLKFRHCVPLTLQTLQHDAAFQPQECSVLEPLKRPSLEQEKHMSHLLSNYCPLSSVKQLQLTHQSIMSCCLIESSVNLIFPLSIKLSNHVLQSSVKSSYLLRPPLPRHLSRHHSSKQSLKNR